MSEKKVLVVDDEPFFVEVLTLRLGASGYTICSAKNGEEAISKARSEKPQLIIMDVMMPLTSGYEALQKIRQDPGTKNIPAIIFSGKAAMRDFFDGISNLEFLHKPFDMKLLIGRVEALIGNPLGTEGRPRYVILAGVEEPLMNKIRDFFLRYSFQVLIVLNENEVVALSEKLHPDIILCQFWEDENILDPRKFAGKLLLKPLVSGIPFYVYCKDTLSLEAMKYFAPERIIDYKETSELLRKLESLELPGLSSSGTPR